MKTKIIGHRGCRGLLPENSIEGFLKAIDLGVDAIELDVVMTKDKQLLVAHDPWFESNISDVVPTGSNNFYQLPIKEIQKQPFGLKKLLDFPNQQKIKVFRPSLSEVIKTCVNYKPDIPSEFFVIEVKSQPEWYKIYQSDVEEYAQLVNEKISAMGIGQYCMIQSFDHNFLNAFYKLRKDIPLGILVEDVFPISGHLALLDFTPNYYNPEHVLVTDKLLNKLKEYGIKCFTWTVNDAKRKEELINLGVAGIITDYP